MEHRSKLKVGIEPTTYRLTVCRTTDCATQARRNKNLAGNSNPGLNDGDCAIRESNPGLLFPQEKYCLSLRSGTTCRVTPFIRVCQIEASRSERRTVLPLDESRQQKQNKVLWENRTPVRHLGREREKRLEDGVPQHSSRLVQRTRRTRA